MAYSNSNVKIQIYHLVPVHAKTKVFIVTVLIDDAFLVLTSNLSHVKQRKNMKKKSDFRLSLQYLTRRLVSAEGVVWRVRNINDDHYD